MDIIALPRRRLRGIALVLVVIAAAAFLGYTWARYKGIEELRAEAGRQQYAFSRALFEPTDKYSYLPEIVADHPIIVDALRHPDDGGYLYRANIFLQDLNRRAKSDTIYVLDAKGLTIASSNWQESFSFVGSNYSYRPYFQDAMRAGSGRFYGIGATSLTPGYYISSVIKHGATAIGVAVIKIDMGTFDAEWPHDRMEAVVTDENGVAFLSSRADWKYRPMHELTPAAREQVKRTRQYDAVLKEPLRLTVERRLSLNEQIVGVDQIGQSGRGKERVLYLMHTRTLDKSAWTLSIFMPMTKVVESARRAAVLAAGGMAFLVLVFMYARQTRNRNLEREKSRRALEEAHRSLEEKHMELQRVSEELRVSAITDPLTGAFNRRFFLESAARLQSAAQRHGYPLSILMIDVDRFKRINDIHGHPAGDKVLQTVTGLCRNTLREADVFARFGGEEFIVALPSTEADAAQQVAERLRSEVMSYPVQVDGNELRLTVSCGISQYRPEEASIEAAIKRADEALYIAKNGGRNQVAVR